MAAEEEVIEELEAAQAVYGDDCTVLEAYPPNLHVHLKPRTADVSSQQFVEAIIGIRAGSQYPEEPPQITIIDSKGLDEDRQKQLLTSIRDKGTELASCSMLVALCEEAVERLSSMNHPDGDCPLCLDPLLDEDDRSNSPPFMKLMSCFHCFHCHCIIRWWNWSQVHKEEELKSSSNASTSTNSGRDRKGMQKMMEEGMGSCPVCRKIFHTKDIEHVLDLVGAGSDLDSDATEIDTQLLLSDSERIRRERFESILKLQEENSGLIEPKKNEVLRPGMFLPPPVVLPSAEPQTTDTGTPAPAPAPAPATAKAKSGTSSGSSTRRPGPRKQGNTNNSNVKRNNTQNNPRNQVRHWARKDTGPANS